MKPGTHTFLPTSRVHFGAGSLDRLEEEARSFERAFDVTGRTLYEKTDLVRRPAAPSRRPRGRPGTPTCSSASGAAAS
jgi:hypothetical protein